MQILFFYIKTIQHINNQDRLADTRRNHNIINT